MELAEIRTKIDETDREIRDLLLKRMGYSHQVAEAKVESGDTTIYRADREASILENLGDSVDEEVRSEYLSVVRKIMETSRMYQYGLIFDWTPKAFEGIKGHELAAGMEAVQGPDICSLARRNSDSRLDVADNGAKLSAKSVTVRLTRENKPNAMSAILSMIGDYGYNMDRMVPVTDAAEGTVVAETSESTEAESPADLTTLETFAETGSDRIDEYAKAGDAKANELEGSTAPENLTKTKKDTVTFDLTILGDLTETNMQKLMFQLNGESLDFKILACR